MVTVMEFRYEKNYDLFEKPRQSADWAGGGFVSSTRDLSRFIRALAEGEIFGEHTHEQLKK